MIDSKIIEKYAKYTVPQLRKKAGIKFRAWIRKRDEGKPCISCGSYNTSDASHYYSAGHFPEVEFNEDNVHLACKKCNMYLHGNLIEYRMRLIQRIGEERVTEIDRIVQYHRRNGYKHDRFKLIEILEKYGH